MPGITVGALRSTSRTFFTTHIVAAGTAQFAENRRFPAKKVPIFKNQKLGD